jgi:hypothetical protein
LACRPADFRFNSDSGDRPPIQRRKNTGKQEAIVAKIYIGGAFILAGVLMVVLAVIGSVLLIFDSTRHDAVTSD